MTNAEFAPKIIASRVDLVPEAVSLSRAMKQPKVAAG